MSKRDLINNINQIVEEMANFLANPNNTLIGKEYFRSESMLKIEKLIEDFFPTEKKEEVEVKVPTFPLRKKKKK